MDSSDENRQRVFTIKPPPPEWPLVQRADQLDLFGVSVAELARQLTLIEWDLWEAIKPWEFLNQAWTKKDKETKAPGIHMLIKHFNYIASWAASSVVSLEALKERVRVIERFVDLASACRDLGNFNAVMEIVSGLGNAGVFRLKQTWAELSSYHKTSFEQLKALMAPEKNFQAFREQLKSVNPPTIPYIGIFLTDLIFINDGSKDFVCPPGRTVQLVNFNKCRMVATHIQLVMQYQQAAYNFQLLPIVEEYLLHNTTAWDEDTIYKLSQYVELRPGGTRPQRPELQPSKRLHPAVFQLDPREYRSPMLVIEHSLVVAATLKKLLRHVASIDRFESLATEIFCSYRLFTSAQKLLRRFGGLLKLAPEEGAQPTANGSTPRIYKLRPRLFVIRRISALLSIWIANFAGEIYLEQSQTAIAEWIASVYGQYDSQHVPTLLRLLDVHVKRSVAMPTKPAVLPPKPILPTHPGTISCIMDFHPLEIARQLALQGFELTRRLTTTDIFDCVRLDAEALRSPSPSVPVAIRRILDHRERLRDWIRAEVSAKSAKKKLAIFEHLVEVMKFALDHLYVLVAGLKWCQNSLLLSCVHRDFLHLQDLYLLLVSTPFADVWAVMSAKTTTDFQTFKNLFNGARDREALRLRLLAIPSASPATPPLGWFFDEISVVRGLPSVYVAEKDTGSLRGEHGADPKRSVINFTRYRRASLFLTQMNSFKIPFNYTSTPFVIDYIAQKSSEKPAEENTPISRQSRAATVGFGAPPSLASLLGTSVSLDSDDFSSLKGARLLSAPKLQEPDSPTKTKSRSGSGDLHSPKHPKSDSKERSHSPAKKKGK